MIKLLINDDSKSDILTETSFGGLPVKEIGKNTEWPSCRTCQAKMQYQGKIKTDIGLELIFMCQNDPGLCDEWDPEGGGNKVIIVNSENLEFFKPLEGESLLRETVYGVNLIETDADDYDSARENWEGNKRQVLGQYDGIPSWIQGDETPECDCCSKSMRFVAQLEEGPDYRTAMNFGGGGVAYLFDCKEGKTAKFLWQC
ncbi:hypothetical protein [Pedobacter sp. MC2016-24]|uniref:hypothetical protein n=1 Tax=Pedobacter sp. MC2016-24 TaxID=2780090 RepID=UPI001882FA6F|nr:hypothetical protein [Pedobacter sp. MC2016-24]MBE9602252.1 hypothetical protein [Pedobacter sp. MC2016-24]